MLGEQSVSVKRPLDANVLSKRFSAKKTLLTVSSKPQRRFLAKRSKLGSFLELDTKKVFMQQRESDIPSLANDKLASKKYAKAYSKMIRLFLGNVSGKSLYSLVNNKEFKLARIGSLFLKNINSLAYKGKEEIIFYSQLQQAKTPVNFYYVKLYTKLVNKRNWLKTLIASANNFDYEVYFSETKNINIDYYSTESTKSLLKNNISLSSLSEKWVGFFVWEETIMEKRFNLSELFSLMGSYKSKFVINVNKVTASSLSQLATRSFFNRKYYRNSARILNQSWGNSGHYTSRTLVKKKYPLNILLTTPISDSTFLEKLENKTYRGTKIFVRKFRFSATSSNLKTADQTYSNWFKAGYVLISNKKEYGSRMKRSNLPTSNFTVMQDSKVFGHPFHLVNPSILPLTMCFVFFTVIQDLLSSFWLEMWYSNMLSVLAHGSMLGLFFSVILTWILEIYSEEQAGFHTIEVQKGFQYGILLFILSELMLFISFFWAYFHFSLNSNSFTGGSYTPIGLVPFFWYRIPLLNTLLLLSSGLSLTVAHMLVNESDKLIKLFIWIDSLSFRLSIDWLNFWNLISGGFRFFAQANERSEGFYIALASSFFRRVQQFGSKSMLSRNRTILASRVKNSKYIGQSDKVGRVSNDFQVNLPKSYIINFRSVQKNTTWQPNFWILDTVLKGFVFLVYQAYEYTSCMFSMNDGVYGAVFFSLTGLHGFHVFLGVMFLFFSLLVNLKKKFRKSYILVRRVNKNINNILESGLFMKSSYGEKVWTHRTAFDGAAWYWHFVDVVWLFVFVFIYWWGFSGDIA